MRQYLLTVQRVVQPRGLRLLWGACAISAALYWPVTGAVIGALYRGDLALLRDRVFRERATFGLDFYLELALPLRLTGLALLGATGAVLFLFTEVPGVFERLRRALRRVNQWIPRQGLPSLAFGVILAGGMASANYRAIGNLGNDMVTYRVSVARLLGSEVARGDHPIRDPDAALYPYAILVRAAGAVFGPDGGLFALFIAAVLVAGFGLYRMAREVFEGGHLSGLIAAVIGGTVSFGSLGYGLSAVHLNPAPRMFAMALALHALVDIHARRFTRGVALGLAATAINTLDGLVPITLALFSAAISGWFSRVGKPSASGSARTSSVWDSSRLLYALVVFAVLVSILEPPSSPAVVYGIYGLWAAVGLSGWRITRRPSTIGDSTSLRAWMALLLFAAAGVVLASLRTVQGPNPGEESFWATLTLHEVVLSRVRNEAMLLLGSQAVAPVASFVFLTALIGFLADRGQSSPLSEQRLPSGHDSFRSTPALTAMVTFAFVFVGSALLEFTSLPLLVTLWPVRAGWVVVALALPMLAVAVERAAPRFGVIPVVAAGSLALAGHFVGRATWSLALLVVGLLLARIRQTPETSGSSDPKPESRAATSSARELLAFATAVAPALIIMGFFTQSGGPEISIESSADRIQSEGGNSAAIVEAARLANTLTPEGSRILVPPAFEWGAFRLLSDRGVGFEFKNYSTANPGLWYSHLRWMCDPTFGLEDDEDFSIGLSDVEECFEQLSLDETMAVAAKFDADFVVARTELVADRAVIGTTSSRSWSLIAVE